MTLETSDISVLLEADGGLLMMVMLGTELLVDNEPLTLETCDSGVLGE